MCNSQLFIPTSTSFDSNLLHKIILYAIIFTDGFSDCTLDSEDENKIRYGYTYQGRQGNNNPQKFLATAMEALLGAYYLDHNESMQDVELVVRGWMEIIDGD